MPRTVRFEKEDKEKVKKAIGYIRVSTIGQVEEGASLEVQENAIKEFCKKREYRLLRDRIYRDEGRSAYRGQKRIGLKNVMSDVINKRCDVVVVYSISRFYRNTLGLLEALKTMKKHHVDFVSISEEYIDTSTPTGEAILQFMGVLAQLESAQTGERVKTVLRQKAKNGEYIGSKAPLGYELVKEVVRTRDGQRVKVIPPYYRKLPRDHPNRKKAETIFRLYGRGTPMQIIAKRVDKNPSTVCNVLANPTYTGLILYEPGDNAFINKGNFEPYISLTTFNANQKRRKNNNFNTKTKNPYFTIHKAKGSYQIKQLK